MDNEIVSSGNSAHRYCHGHLIDVHQNAVFKMGKTRWRARVTDNRCKDNKQEHQYLKIFTKILKTKLLKITKEKAK